MVVTGAHKAHQQQAAASGSGGSSSFTSSSSGGASQAAALQPAKQQGCTTQQQQQQQAKGSAAGLATFAVGGGRIGLSTFQSAAASNSSSSSSSGNPASGYQSSSSSSTSSSSSSSTGGGAAATFAGPSPGRAGRASFRPAGAPAPRAPPPPLSARVRGGLADAAAGWRAGAPRVGRAWLADLAFNAWSLPLQAASLLVVPVFWTLPRLLSIQLAVPSAILAGTGPRASLDASRALMAAAGAGAAAAYAWPYLGLTLASRGADALKQALLAAVPERWWQEVIEVPIAALLAFAALKVVVARMQDLLPLAAYLRMTSAGGAGGGSGGAGGSSGGSSGSGGVASGGGALQGS